MHYFDFTIIPLKALGFLKKRINRITHFLPTALPREANELEALFDDVLFTYDIPNDPIYHHAMASLVMHLGPLTTRKSKRFFAHSVIKQIANQVAYDKIQEIKKEAMKREELAKQEATPPTELTCGERLQAP